GRNAEARVVVDPADEDLLTPDRMDVHAGDELVERDAVPGAERGVGHYASTTSRTGPSGCATAASASSSSYTTTFPLRVGSAFAAGARSPRSGVIGSSVIQTRIASWTAVAIAGGCGLFAISPIPF